MLSIDLKGPQGNAFYVMGAVSRALKQLKRPAEEIDEYRNQCMSSDYGNLLKVSQDILDKHHIEYDFTGGDDDEDDWEDVYDDDDDE